MQWFKFLIMTTRWAISCPWFVYIAAVDDAFHRPRALTDQVEMLTRSDVMVMVGGRMSAHMRVELTAVRMKVPQIPVIDLLHLGVVPPWGRIDQVGSEIRKISDDLDL